MEFRMNTLREQVVLLFKNHTLLVVMRNKHNFKDIKIFCYNTDETSHSSLYSVIPLEEEFYASTIKLYLGFNQYFTYDPLYVTYDSKKIRMILVEQDIFIAQTDLSNNKIFLPQHYKQLTNYYDDNVTISIYPYHRSSTNEANLHTKFLCFNYGLLIETPLKSHTLRINSHIGGNVTISLLDYFNGFNNSFEYKKVKSEQKSSLDYLEFEISQNSLTTYILESPKSNQNVIYSFEYMSVYLLIFFSGEDFLVQSYNITNGISKLNQEYNYSNLFDKCIIQYIHYDIVTSTNSSYITVNCDDASNQVHMEYEFRLFYIEILTEDKFKLQLISKNKIATPVAETQFFRSPKSNSTYFLIVLTELEIDNTDSNLFILKFNCTRPNECKYLKYTKLTGYRLEYNKFFSISCTYLNEYPILVAGLNDFGLRASLFNCNDLYKLQFFIPFNKNYILKNHFLTGLNLI